MQNKVRCFTSPSMRSWLCFFSSHPNVLSFHLVCLSFRFSHKLPNDTCYSFTEIFVNLLMVVNFWISWCKPFSWKESQVEILKLLIYLDRKKMYNGKDNKIGHAQCTGQLNVCKCFTIVKRFTIVKSMIVGTVMIQQEGREVTKLFVLHLGLSKYYLLAIILWQSCGYIT